MYNRRFEFYNYLEGLIYADCEARKREIDDSDSNRYQKREEINTRCRTYIKWLRRYYFGAKNENHCFDCQWWDEHESRMMHRSGVTLDDEDGDGDE